MTTNLVAKLRLRHFSLIRALDEHRNMHRAADALNMTQSTASKMLRDIEGILGTPLFVRETRGMTPTDMGRQAAQFSDEILVRITRFSEEFDSQLAGGHGLLVIGAIMGAAPDLVAKIVGEMKAERPLLTIRMLGETSDNILDLLEAGELDIAVGRFSTIRQQALFDFEHLSEEPLELVVRKDHPLHRGVNKDIASLHSWPWILQPPATPTRQLMDRAFAEAGLSTPRNHVECMSIFAILHLVQTSDAITLLPASVVRDHLRAGLLCTMENPFQRSVAGFGIMMRRDRQLSEAAEAFAEKLRRAASS